MIRKGLLTLSTLAAFAGVASMANADTYYYKHTTTTTTTAPVSTTTTTVDPVVAEINERNAKAMAIHDQAVTLAHQATALAQRGDKQAAASMAAEAQSLFNESFAMTHPTFYAHRTGD